MTTLAARAIALTAEFRRAGVKRARFESRELLCEALQLSPDDLYRRGEESLTANALNRIAQFAARRFVNEPLAYICGRSLFGDLCLEIDRRALIPRPETEQMAKIAAQFLQLNRKNEGRRVLDLGCGSGCLAIYLKKRFPQLAMMGSDQSMGALELARQNGTNHGVDITWRCGSWFEPWQGESFDFIVTNPPYISNEQWGTLAPEVRDFEPKAALIAGPSGLEAFEAIASAMRSHLRPGGRLLAEMGYDQAVKVRALFSKRGYLSEIEKDDWGKDRFVSAYFIESS